MLILPAIPSRIETSVAGDIYARKVGCDAARPRLPRGLDLTGDRGQHMHSALAYFEETPHSFYGETRTKLARDSLEGEFGFFVHPPHTHSMFARDDEDMRFVSQ